MEDQKTGAEVRDYMVTRLGQTEQALVNALNCLDDVRREASEQDFGLTAAWAQDVAIRVERALEQVRSVYADYLATTRKGAKA